MNIDNNNVNNINFDNLKYNFIKNDRYIHVKNNDSYFTYTTPFLKVLKKEHIVYNKKKTISKKYLILEINDDLDISNDIMYVINKIHEISQENIKNNSKEWFKTEFDNFGLDIKIRRPIDFHKENEFVKLCIPSENDYNNINNKILNLKEGEYILCNIIFKGLKVTSDYINEEWEILNFVTENEFDDIENIDYVNSVINNTLLHETIVENDNSNDNNNNDDDNNDNNDDDDNNDNNNNNDYDEDDKEYSENEKNQNKNYDIKKIKYSKKIINNKEKNENNNKNELIKKSKKIIFT